jgi:hypothetical protein
MIDTTVNQAVDDREGALNQALLYPLRFEPIYQYRLWGGRHLADLLTAPLPGGPDFSRDRPSVNCCSSSRSKSWESWPGASPDSPCC